MSIADEIQKLIPAKPSEKSKLPQANLQQERLNQLQRLEEVEKSLANIGVSLEPSFDISLNSRFTYCES